MALKVGKIIAFDKSPLSRTILQKRKLIALYKTLKALFINMRRMAKGNHNFIPLFYIWTIDPTNFHGNGPNQCHGNCAWMQDMVTDTYRRALSGLFESGILREMMGLIS
ncbi:MAG: hypothetical protein ACTSYB_00210 [Candidatus Helarchaeota archaeon]